MSHMHQEWTDRFTDYLSGELDEDARNRLEEHVAECGACRGVLEGLREVVSRARGLAEVRPTRDLWPGIAAGIRTPLRAKSETTATRVIALPTAGKAVDQDPRRIAFTPPQLAAAAVLLIAFSAVTTWLAGPGLGVPAVASTTEPVTGAATLAAVTPAAATPAPPEALSGELAALEEVLSAARSRLDPNTVRVLERNLAVIERAIADSHQALALDPENHFLTEHLDRVYQRKIEYLRDAARVIDWAG